MTPTMFLRTMLVLAAALLLGACAAGGGVRSSSKAPPEVRAVERWNLLIAKQAEKAYDYMTPGKRATDKREDYAQRMNNRPVRWEKVVVTGTECSTADSCVVNLQLDITVPIGGSMVSSLSFLSESWIRDADGSWYFLGAARPVEGKENWESTGADAKEPESKEP